MSTLKPNLMKFLLWRHRQSHHEPTLKSNPFRSVESPSTSNGSQLTLHAAFTKKATRLHTKSIGRRCIVFYCIERQREGASHPHFCLICCPHTKVILKLRPANLRAKETNDSQSTLACFLFLLWRGSTGAWHPSKCHHYKGLRGLDVDVSDVRQ